MKLHLLEELIDRYLKNTIRQDLRDWYFSHALVDQFHNHWVTPDVSTLIPVYDQCLRSEWSQRWWKRDHYRPKEIMLKLMSTEPELAMIAWKDLANENASLDGRLFRFNHYCEDLLQILRQKHPASVETFHHQDASIISLYLAGIHPDKYSLYPGLEVFQHFCKKVGSPDLPVIDDLVRYQKVTKIIFTFLQRNANFKKLIEQRTADGEKVKFLPLQTSYEITIFSADNQSIL